MSLQKRVTEIENRTPAEHIRRAAEICASPASYPDQPLMRVLIELAFAVAKGQR